MILHAVRLRIVQAMFDGQVRTTSQLRELLPDVSKATVYRHVAVLVTGGMLEVAGEEKVHGIVERTYRLHRERTAFAADEIAAMTIEDHRRGFAAVLAALLAEFNRYLDRDGADPVADSASYRQTTLWLSDSERSAFIGRVRAVIQEYGENAPAPDRRQHLLTTIMFPTDGPGT